MGLALDEAAAAMAHDDVPVGAVVVVDGTVIARGHNRRTIDGDPTAHAEVVALRAAARAVGGWRLERATLYVTLEPCLMCAGALLNARIARLVIGADDPKAGATGSLYNLVDDPRLNHTIALTTRCRAEESANVLQGFFQARR